MTDKRVPDEAGDMEDASLDEFLDQRSEAEAGDGAGESAQHGDEDEAGDGVADAVGGEAETPAPEPAAVTPTYRWDPDGGPCAACGGVAAERWQDEAGFVCADCKDW